MITRFTIELADGRTMTAVRQNRTADEGRTLLAGAGVAAWWDPADAFPLSMTSDAESQ